MRLSRRSSRRPGWPLKSASKLLLACLALFLFLVSLETIRSSAAGVGPILLLLRADGILNLFGLGWLMAYGVLSGSPVAAVSLGLFGAGAIQDTEALGMIAGSRFGAAFVVLLFGAIAYYRQRRKIITVATGILSLLVTWTIYAPATLMAFGLLSSRSLDWVRLTTPGVVLNLQGAIVKAIVGPVAALLHPFLLFLAGVGLLLGAFNLFDRALPELNPNHGRFRQIADIIYRPKVMFLLGIAITCLTLSVSVSVGLLVPISAKGYVRRENIIPFVMGANISTFIDTLFVALLVGNPRAGAIVLAEMVSVSIVSLIVLAFFYKPYGRFLEAALEAATRSPRSFAAFLGMTMAIPLFFLIL